MSKKQKKSIIKRYWWIGLIASILVVGYFASTVIANVVYENIRPHEYITIGNKQIFVILAGDGVDYEAPACLNPKSNCVYIPNLHVAVPYNEVPANQRVQLPSYNQQTPQVVQPQLGFDAYNMIYPSVVVNQPNFPKYNGSKLADLVIAQVYIYNKFGDGVPDGLIWEGNTSRTNMTAITGTSTSIKGLNFTYGSPLEIFVIYGNTIIMQNFTLSPDLVFTTFQANVSKTSNESVCTQLNDDVNSQVSQQEQSGMINKPLVFLDIKLCQ